MRQKILGPKSLAGLSGAPVLDPKQVAIARIVRAKFFGIFFVFILMLHLSVTAKITIKNMLVPITKSKKAYTFVTY